MAAVNEKPQQQKSFKQQQQENRKAQALQINPVRLPFPEKEAAKFGCDEGLWRALVDSTWPSARSVDAVMLALIWCRKRNLDPLKKPCHIVPIWNSQLGREVESVWPSIAEVRITAFRTGEYCGCDDTVFGPEITTTFEGDVDSWRDGQRTTEHKKITLRHPEWAQITVYRFVHGEPRKFVGPKVFFLAAYGCIGKTDLPNEKWAEPGAQMLDKCAEAAALRKAFPEELGSMQTAEEMEGRKFVDFGEGMEVASPEPAPAAPKRSDFGDKQQPIDVGDTGESEPELHPVIDETGVVVESYADDGVYCDAIIAMFDRATELKHVDTIADNNRPVLDKLPRELGRKARDAFIAARKRLSQSGDAPGATGQAAEPGRDAARGPSHPAANGEKAQTHSLFNGNGKVVAYALSDHTFAIEVVKLFDAAEMRVDLEALYRANNAVIRDLPDAIRDTILDDYEKAMAKFKRG